MKILLAVPDLDAASGGPAVVVTRLAAELLARGHAVAIAYMVPHSGSLQVVPPQGVELLQLPRARHPWQRFRQFKQAVDHAITHWGAQLLHDHGMWLPENAAAAVASRSKACPFISQPCGMLQEWPMSQSPLKKKLAWHMYQSHLLAHASAVIVTSHKEKRESEIRLQSKAPSYLIPHGVDLPTLTVSSARRRQAVFMGRLHPVKQVDVLLRAWALLKPEDWQLKIAGSGDPAYEQHLRELTQQLGVVGSVKFVGLVQGSDKADLLAQSQLFLQPSLQENFGLAVAEAMAYGLPVLTTKAMPWEEVVAAHCGWSVPVELGAIQAALAEALASPAEELLAMGMRARKLAASYSWEKITQQLIDIYRHVLN